MPALSRLSRSPALRFAVVSASLVLGPVGGPVSAQLGNEQVQPDIENSRYQVAGVLTQPEFIRSGPGDNFYPTCKLEQGAHVTVVGSKNSWLKILPPEGSVSYVQKVQVQRFGDGKQGKATGSQPIVKAGSTLQPDMKWAVQTKLQQGQTVEILGEDETYFKIKPPAGAYMYVAQTALAVAPQQPAEATAGGTAGKPAGAAQPAASGQPAAAGQPAAPVAPPVSVAPPVAAQPHAGQPEAAAGVTSPAIPAMPPTQADSSAAAPGTESIAGAPATQSVGQVEQPQTPASPLTAAEAVAKLAEMESRFADASQQPLSDQPLDSLMAGYEQIAGSANVNELTKRVVEARLNTLKVRADSRRNLLTTTQQRQAGRDRLVAQQAEQQELQQQMARVEMSSYAAVGTLRPSSIQVSKTPLYRLTDTQTGRTLAYVWGTNPKVATMVEQFVGVRGPIETDARLSVRVINPSDIEIVDVSKFNTAYLADIAPASLQPRTPTASTKSE